MIKLGHGWHRVPMLTGFYVYAFWGEHETRPLYIGKSRTLHGRLGSHLSSPEKLALITDVSAVRCRTAQEMDALEVEMIRKLRPPWNRAGLLTATGKRRRTRFPWDPPVTSSVRRSPPEPDEDDASGDRVRAALDTMFSPPAELSNAGLAITTAAGESG